MAANAAMGALVGRDTLIFTQVAFHATVTTISGFDPFIASVACGTIKHNGFLLSMYSALAGACAWIIRGERRKCKAETTRERVRDMITKETGMFCLNSTITRQDENTVLVGRGNINTKEHVIRIEIAQDSA